MVAPLRILTDTNFMRQACRNDSGAGIEYHVFAFLFSGGQEN